MKYNGPKVKLSRKVGFAIAPKARKVLDRKPGTPGQHGNARRRPKQSDYSKQLLEKQRLRLQYNIHERQMTNTMAKASRLKGNKVDVLVQLLESRLDASLVQRRNARSCAVGVVRVRRQHGHNVSPTIVVGAGDLGRGRSRPAGPSRCGPTPPRPRNHRSATPRQSHRNSCRRAVDWPGW